jgi:hypothetical protein
MPTIESITKMLDRVPRPAGRTDINQLNEETMRVVIEAKRAKEDGAPDVDERMAEAQRVLDLAWGEGWGTA